MMPAFLAAARLLVGGVFVYAGVTKVVDLSTFAEEIANYQVVPPATVPWFAAAMPGIEILAGGLLVLGLWARSSAALLTALLVMFIVALSQALARGIDLRCGCFGGAEVATWGTVGRDLAMLVPATAVALRGAGRWSLGRS